ncbi:MAG: menaquinol oxidoreductase [Nitrospirae bacterium CG_4_10_14_3_um_filter_44_29]|nr:menaquinol oxidoreductase [Nitrospirota bacterium]OIO29789.1 MAG: menaquinol oxidoreductase [Nitrospirae bacterium CG1_02_44_142]PIP70252.1 MAG: menaquinol oxidoreductase [Nitrospirae bacterium CG22_combo_CG10-13_8_21_14_all_44_11]PIV39955.1 MAG: menaquinol oxidoreductase [Nitrospirae bacterium CG02_land_8_20_14_3_00_44_33]PIV66469.1 MAG: menaquinol oxidoreductase [Nitrospirae bacterium CG01_land_8_20_14_3_00_44_22]PIW88692.1 MAG: menaquinol oxidoreductase [Nitrospirae bacterium CG_4_8_14_3
MRILFSFFAVIALALIAYAGVKIANLQFLFGVVIPYIAIAIFILGFIYRVLKWGSSPVPFRIPTTCGQQESLSWIKQNKIENPSSASGVVIRMALEVLLFRSLFRNLKTQLKEGKLVYGEAKWLWLAGLAFHWSFLIIFVRHFRFFLQNTPSFIKTIEGLDSFLQVGVPLLYMTDIVLLGAVTYLFLRRVFIPQVNYISLAADYFPLFLILGIASSGVVMRYFYKVHIVGVKELAMGLVTLSPVIPQGVGVMFYIHLFLICTLLAYFPLSKLMHMGGVFLSPTRNMANNSRRARHINPWNYPVHIHTYEEYENDFREKMKKAGIPVEKE